MEWTRGIVSRQPVNHGRGLHPRVAILTYSDGQKLLVKVAKSQEAAEREAVVLRSLNGIQAPVPRLVDYLPDGVLVMEYLGGPTLGTIQPEEFEQNVGPFFDDWKRLQRSWPAVWPKIKGIVSPTPVSDFHAFLESLGAGLWPRASRPRQAEQAWQQIVELALDAPRAVGSLDYNPHNVIYTGRGFVFCDFESIGWDWDFRRLWQYTTQIWDRQGRAGWRPLLRGKLPADEVAQAHYILFAAVAWRRHLLPNGVTISPAELWGTDEASHPAVIAWQKAWIS